MTGKNLNVTRLAARLVSGLSGPARLTCITMEADQLHPLPGDGPVATADERRNIAGLDNVMNVLEMSPLLKKLPARRMSSSTTSSETKDEPIAMWLVRYVGLVSVMSLRSKMSVAGRHRIWLASRKTG